MKPIVRYYHSATTQTKLKASARLCERETSSASFRFVCFVNCYSLRCVSTFANFDSAAVLRSSHHLRSPHFCQVLMATPENEVEASLHRNRNTEQPSNVDFGDNPSGDAEDRDTNTVDDGDEEIGDELEEEEEEDDGNVPDSTPSSRESDAHEQRVKMENLFRRLASERVPVRVHDVLIRGNIKTKEWIIEGEMERIKNVTTMQELLEAASIANAMLQGLDIFESVKITLDSGPAELPGTANVIVDIVESSSSLTGEVGCYTKPTARSWTVEGGLKFKNWFGYGDLWDGSLAYGPHQTSEVSVGVFLPRVKGALSPVTARLSLLSQDWMEFSSYKERLLGLSLGLLQTKNHDLVYNLGWRTLTDPSQMSSRSIRRQLGHGLLSTLKYTFKIDHRNSQMRPTKGYAFLSTTQVGGLAPDPRSVQFLRQEFDLRCAIPLGYCHAALNLGLSAGVVFPWGHGSLNKPSPLPDRFFLGGDFSPVCVLGGPTTVWGFKTRGLGPTEPRRTLRINEESSGRDSVGGDLAVTAFADLSFNFPMKWLRELGVHGHVFAGMGNTAKLTEKEYQNFAHQKFFQSFRRSLGIGVVVPTKLFRLEGNFYHILKQHEYDNGKSGFRFSFSAPT